MTLNDVIWPAILNPASLDFTILLGSQEITEINTGPSQNAYEEGGLLLVHPWVS